MNIINLGFIDFISALAVQERLLPLVAAGDEPETLLLTEHPSVYTVGRLGNAENLLDRSLRPAVVNRGGDVTWHGPGQLVGYPLVDLGKRGRDLHRYLRFLEEVLIGVCSGFGVDAFRRPGLTGVWTGAGKVASIGVGVRRWVTMHGFALNVDVDTAPFAAINPCGIPRCPVTSLARDAGTGVEVDSAGKEVSLLLPRLLDTFLPVV